MVLVFLLTLESQLVLRLLACATPARYELFSQTPLSEILATSSMSNLSKLAVLLPLLLLMFLYMPILYFSQTKLFLPDC